jgi:hypothetical protein
MKESGVYVVGRREHVQIVEEIDLRIMEPSCENCHEETGKFAADTCFL